MKNRNKNEEADLPKNNSEIVKSVQEIMKKNVVQTAPEEEPKQRVMDSWGAKKPKR